MKVKITWHHVVVEVVGRNLGKSDPLNEAFSLFFRIMQNFHPEYTPPRV